MCDEEEDIHNCEKHNLYLAARHPPCVPKVDELVAVVTFAAFAIVVVAAEVVLVVVAAVVAAEAAFASACRPRADRKC